MGPPWLKPILQELLADGTLGRRRTTNHKHRSVQAIKSNEDFRYLIINDTDHYATLFLTPNCIEDMAQKEVTIMDLKNTVIKLEKYHFTTIIASVGSRDESKYQSLGISFPVAIQCDKLSLLGGDDVEVMGAPHDLNRDDDIKNIISKMEHCFMSRRLGMKQFPQMGLLPNAGEYLSLISALSIMCFHPAHLLL